MRARPGPGRTVRLDAPPAAAEARIEARRDDPSDATVAVLRAQAAIAPDAIEWPRIDASGGVLDQDYEMFEIHDPHFLLKHEYLPDSAGAGRWRGGYGTSARWQMNGEKVVAVTIGQGTETGEEPIGLFGGKRAGEVATKVADVVQTITGTDDPAAAAEQVPNFRYFQGGHPVPNAESLRAGDVILKSLRRLQVVR